MSMFEMYNKLNDTASHKDTTAQRPLIGPLATKTATPIKIIDNLPERLPTKSKKSYK